MVDTVTGLRERTRRAVRRELMSAAMELFLQQGYDDTTVEQISLAVGLSRRSFFRYFASKDEILAESLAAVGEAIAVSLTARPDDEDPWLALRGAFDVLLAQIASDDRARAMTGIMLQSPSMRGSHAEKQTSWNGTISRALALRLGDQPDTELRAQALTAAALGCLTTAQLRWVSPTNTANLAELLDTTMNAVRPPAEDH